MSIVFEKSFLKRMALFTIAFVVMYLFGVVDAIAATPSPVSSDVIAKVRERAIIVIEHYKPIVYILGGFGLLCVAWGAVFGKMNWKWFANLAIGLFLVAWMGHLIDYFTFKKDNATNAFQITTIGASQHFGDTMNKRSQADSGKFIAWTISCGNSATCTRIKEAAQWADSDWVEAEQKHMGNDDFRANARSVLAEGKAYMVKGADGREYDIKDALKKGSALSNAKIGNEYYGNTGSNLVAGSISVKSGESYAARGNVSSDWEAASEKYKDEMHVAHAGSNIVNGSFEVMEEDGKHTYLAGGNAATNFRTGVMSSERFGTAGFGDAQTLMEHGEFEGYRFGNSDYVQFEIAGLADDIMYDQGSMMMGYDSSYQFGGYDDSYQYGGVETEDFSGLNTESQKGANLTDNFDSLNQGSNLVGNRGNVGSDWSDTDYEYTASNLTTGTLTYTDATGEHTDDAEGNVHTTLTEGNDDYGYQGDISHTNLASGNSEYGYGGDVTHTNLGGANSELGYQGDVNTNMNSAAGYHDVNTNMNSAAGYHDVNTNMNSAAGYHDVNTNMNSAAGYHDVNTNMNSPAGYQDVSTNLNSSRGYADEETHWGR